MLEVIGVQNRQDRFTLFKTVQGTGGIDTPKVGINIEASGFQRATCVSIPSNMGIDTHCSFCA